MLTCQTSIPMYFIGLSTYRSGSSSNSADKKESRSFKTNLEVELVFISQSTTSMVHTRKDQKNKNNKYKYFLKIQT